MLSAKCCCRRNLNKEDLIFQAVVANERPLSYSQQQILKSAPPGTEDTVTLARQFLVGAYKALLVLHAVGAGVFSFLHTLRQWHQNRTRRADGLLYAQYINCSISIVMPVACDVDEYRQKSSSWQPSRQSISKKHAFKVL